MEKAIQAKSTQILRFSMQYSSVALLYYDYSLTWTREVRHFWIRKPSFSTILYFCCRYGMVANVLYTLALAERLPTMSCDDGYRVCSIISVIGRTAIVVVWGTRTYAVCNRNKIILTVIGLLGMAVVALSALHVNYVGCNGSRGQPPAPKMLSTFTVLYEVVSVFLSSFWGIQALRVNGPLNAQKDGLNYLLLEQGLLYFGLVTAFSITSLILQWEIPTGSFFQRLLTAYTLPLSGQMTARFLLHLREWDYKKCHGDDDENSMLHSPIKENHPNIRGELGDLVFKRTMQTIPTTTTTITSRFGFTSQWNATGN